MLRKFPSLKQPMEIGFAYDTDAWSNRTPDVHYHFRAFQTYGDGLIQHSNDWPVTREQFADYVASFAKAMLADEELIGTAFYAVGRGRVDDKAIAFAASVVYKESDGDYGKRRYVSFSLKEISKGRSKEFDKRFQQIEPWMDGSPKAVFRMLCGDETHYGMELYGKADCLREWWLEHGTGGWNMEMPGTFLEWTKDSHEARQMRYGYHAALAVVRSYNMRQEAETCLRNLNWPVKKEEEASSAA